MTSEIRAVDRCGHPLLSGSCGLQLGHVGAHLRYEMTGADRPAVPPTDAAPGKKFDAGKPRWDLLPWISVSYVVHVLTMGADKYGPGNWRGVAGWEWRYPAAAFRHLSAWMMGEKVDPESGLPHLSHAMCCLLFMLELDDEAYKAAHEIWLKQKNAAWDAQQSQTTFVEHK